MPKTETARFRFAFLLLGSIVIVGVLLWFVGAIIEPVRIGGFAV